MSHLYNTCLEGRNLINKRKNVDHLQLLPVIILLILLFLNSIYVISIDVCGLIINIYTNQQNLGKTFQEIFSENM